MNTMLLWNELLYIVFIAAVSFSFLRILTKSLFLLFAKKGKNVERPPLTVLIAARNEEENLKLLVPKLMDQQYPEFEVVIALDRCSDNSLDIVKAFEKKYDKLRTIIIDNLPDQFSPKKFALTLGIKGARYDWVVLTDADCLPNTDRWLSTFGKKMDEDTDFILGFSPYRKSHGFLNHYIRYETFLTAYAYLSAALMGNPYMGVGRNIAYRKSLFLKLKGYNKFQGLMGGDDDLFVQYHAKSSRTKINIGADSLTYSDTKSDASAYWIQKKRHFSVSKFYTLKSRLLHFIYSMLQILLWTSFAILAFKNHELWIIVSLFAGLLLFKGLVYWGLSGKLGEGYSFILTPVLEACHVVFVPFAAMVSTFSKKVKWK
jgi:cellulose synthase/poly-beta-1,6-N-acetylglucosamine synthase-like glycosyltransferase